MNSEDGGGVGGEKRDLHFPAANLVPECKTPGEDAVVLWEQKQGSPSTLLQAMVDRMPEQC